MIRRIALLCSGLAAIVTVPAFGQANDLATRFGARPTVIDMAISPSGQKIAFLTPGGPLEENLVVIDLSRNGEMRPVARDSNAGGFLTGCSWASDNYLVCYFRGTEEFGRYRIGFSRLLVVAADGSGVRSLELPRGRSVSFNQSSGSVLALDVPGKPDTILLTTVTPVAMSTGSLIGGRQAGVGVDEVDLATLDRHQVMRPREQSVGYLVDETGEVRIMGTISRGSGGMINDDQLEYSYRTPGGNSFQSLVPDRELEDVYYVGVDRAANRAFLLGEEDGFNSLFSIALDGSGRTERLLSREGHDVDDVLTMGRQNRVIGGSFATDRRHFEYFDETYRQLAANLTVALPGNPQVEIFDASADEQRLLVFAHADNDPGIYYLLDRSNNRMDQILPNRRELEGQRVANVTPVRFAARDGVEIPGYLTLPPGSDGRGLPAIVMPHGGPGARDEWGFDWLAQFFAASGYAVLQPNFRGSTGYGSAWEMENGFQSWRTAIADVGDAGRWLVGEGIADPARLAVVGWSYGGYAALQVAATEPNLFKAVVAVAPVTDLGRLRDDYRGFTNYDIVSEFLGNGEHIASGSPARHADAIVAPVMLFHGDLDEQVPIIHSEMMRDALEDAGRDVRYTTFAGMDHSLWDSAPRAQMLSEAAAFLAGALPGPADASAN